MSQLGGKALLEKLFAGSLVKALQFAYPGHEWLPWKFEQSVPVHFWDQKDHQRQFMNWLGNELGFKEMQDWYRVTWKDIQEKGGSGLLDKYRGSPSQLVQTVYPEHVWNMSKLKKTLVW